MINIEYIQGERELLDSIKPLWDKLNNHHGVNCENFSEYFSKHTFEVRKKKFEDNNGKIKIDLVKDKEKVVNIGYCVSTINEELIGEIDSLYVDSEYRKFGIGDTLMKRALGWLNENNAKKKKIEVVEGNENVLSFYKRFGFHTKMLVLEETN